MLTGSIEFLDKKKDQEKHQVAEEDQAEGEAGGEN